MEKNNSIPRAQLTKVPGNLMPVAARDNKIKDMTKLTRIELLDLKRREEQLLANIATLKHLPDKGARVKLLLDKVLAELKRREDVEEAAIMFSKLNIATRGVHALNELEWSNGKVNAEALASQEPKQNIQDSDDDDDDTTDLNLLRAIANRNKQKIKILPIDPSLITTNDILDIKNMQASNTQLENPNGITIDEENEDIASSNINVAEKLNKMSKNLEENISSSSSSQSDASEVNKHMRYLIDITELSVGPQREKYKPYQTTISNVHDPAKERMREKPKNWENTAATPPLIQNDGAKMISLMDSMNMQIEYLSRLKVKIY